MALTGFPFDNLVEFGLSIEQTKAIHVRYLAGESIDGLLAELGIDINKARFPSLFRRMPTDALCPYCKTAMLEDLPSKSNRSGHNVYCETCNHECRPQHPCSCSGCREAAESLLVNEFYDALAWETSDMVLLEGMTVLELLTLHALMSRGDEDEMIVPLFEIRGDKASPLLPSRAASLDLVQALLARKIIFPVPQRNLKSALRIEQNRVVANYGYFHWIPHVAIAIDDDGRSTFDDIKVQLDQWFYKLKTDATPAQMRAILQLIKSIAVDEAWCVIDDLSATLNFDANERGGKLEQLVNQGCLKFTPGQFHYFCSKSVRDGYLAYKENRTNSRRHAINMVPWRMGRLLDRCEAESWEVRPHGTPRLQCRLEVMVQEVLSGILGLAYSMETHSPLDIEAALRAAGYLLAAQEPA